MENLREIIKNAQQTIIIEANSIKNLLMYVDNDFSEVVSLLLNCEGRFIISGIGKSAIIAQKIVATLNSTGTPSLFMHAADAIHGDLGMIQSNDIVMIISKSGNTPEIKTLLPIVKQYAFKTIGMVGQIDSYLAKNSDYIINTTVEEEACPNNLAPTSSTTAQLVMGDAIAVCLIKAKNFTSHDFAKYHPGGTLGKQLFLKTEHFVNKSINPTVFGNNNISTIINTITKNRLGAVCVVDKNNTVLGIITDGDIRRMLEKSLNLNDIIAHEIMTPNPISISKDEMAIDAARIMTEKKITQLVITQNKTFFGIIHIHDLNKEGIH